MKKFHATLSPTATISSEDVQTESLRRYLVDLIQYAPLTEEEEAAGFRAMKDPDPKIADAARTWMIEANLRLAVAVAKSYQGRGMEMSDIVQEGNIGLIKAVDTFDLARGYRFSTYAIWKIHRQIFIAFSSKSGAVAVPYRQFVGAGKRARIIRDMAISLGHAPSPEEVFDAMGLSPTQFDKILSAEAASGIASIDAEIPNSNHRDGVGSTFAEMLQAPDPPEVEFEAVQIASIPTALRRLSPEQEIVLRLRYRIGLPGDEMTLQEIADLFTVTKERVRQIERDGVERLRKIIGPEGERLPSVLRRPSMEAWLGRCCGRCRGGIDPSEAFCSRACARAWWERVIRDRRKVSD